MPMTASPRSKEATMAEQCPICDEPFKPADICADDIELGCCHALCLVGSPVVDLSSGEEMPDGKIAVYFYSEEAEGGDNG